MLTINQSKSIHTEAYIYLKTNAKLKALPMNSISLRVPLSFFKPSNSSQSNSISIKPQIQKPIICARNKKRRSGSERSLKFMLQSAYFIATKLNLIPEPVHFVLSEFGGGNGGGGLGSNKDFGWGGFDGRRRKRKFEFLGFLIVLGLGAWFVLGKEVNLDVFLGFSLFCLVGLSAIWGKIKVQDWFLGFCSCAFLVVLGLKREKFKNWAKGFRVAGFFRRGRTSRFWLR